MLGEWIQRKRAVGNARSVAKKKANQKEQR
jgi:hypothetical protein